MRPTARRWATTAHWWFVPQPFYVTSQPEKTDQAPLTVTSTSGVYGTALALTTSGGSGTGAVSYAVTNGTASGCALFYAALLSTSAGTCIVVATKAGDATITRPPRADHCDL